jgi:hypothetical protein
VDSSPRKCGFQYLKVDSSLGEMIRLTPCFSWGNVKSDVPGGK